MVRAIIFDFDGVLVNSELLHFEAFQRSARDVGLELSQAEYFENMIGYDDRGCWKALAAMKGIKLSQSQLLELCAYKAQVTRDLILQKKYHALPGVEQTVRSLWRSYPLAICSGALRDEIELMLQGIGLRDCIRVITAAEDVVRGKPDPEGYLKTLDALSQLDLGTLTTDQCLIFEDAPTLIANVRPLGFKTIGVPTSKRREELAHADAIVDSMAVDDVRRAWPELELFTEA
jgi:HAD superfamily hydrolase (TIGR01509 family)